VEQEVVEERIWHITDEEIVNAAEGIPVKAVTWDRLPIGVIRWILK